MIEKEPPRFRRAWAQEAMYYGIGIGSALICFAIARDGTVSVGAGLGAVAFYAVKKSAN